VKLCHLLALVLAGNVDEQVDDPLGVTPFVVVPGDELDEVLVQGDTSLGIEDGGVWVTDEISGDELIVGEGEHTLHGTVSSLLDGLLDFVIGSGLLETDDEIDNGDIRKGDTERHTGELAVEAGNNLSDSLGSTSRRRNDVGGSTTPTTPVLVGRTIDGLLGGSGSMDSGHETLNDAEVVMDDLCEGSKAVGCARGVGDDLVLGIIGVQVDAADEHGRICGRCRDDDLLGTALQMGTSLLNRCEDTSGLDDVLGTILAPGDLGRVLLTVH